MTMLDRLALDGKTAIVTGGSRGIGLACARTLHELGVSVVLTSRDDKGAATAAAEIGSRALGLGAHAASPDAAEACVRAALETFGSADILINNAGTNPAYGPTIDQDRERFLRTVEVNLWAPVLWTSVVAKAWMLEHGGVVVNTASAGGYQVVAGLGVYNTTKAALSFMTRQLAFELAPRIRVNAVAPGLVRTRLSAGLFQQDEPAVAASLPLERLGEPQDVADAVAFLASPASAWTTGETVIVDGGQYTASPAHEYPSADRAGSR
jgi:NAD(P)-dependent dehydrogenase (short-subunit alcohol dehydrogenase family)